MMTRIHFWWCFRINRFYLKRGQGRFYFLKYVLSLARLALSLSEAGSAWCRKAMSLIFSSTKVDFIWVFWSDDSFACLTRLSSNGRRGLAVTVTVGLCFCVDSDSASSVSVLDLVCVCCWCFVVFSFVLGNNKQHCSWSWIDAMVSLISRWILSLVMLTG